MDEKISPTNIPVNRRLLPHVSFKTPYAKTPHPLNHFKLMTPRRDDHRPSTTSMQTITTTTTTMVAQARRLQQRLYIHGGEHRLAARAPSETCELTSKQRAPCETCELGLNDPDSEKTMEDQTSKTQKVLAQVKRVTPGLMARDDAFFFHSDLVRMMLTLHRDLHHAHPDTNMSKRHPRRFRRFCFFVVLSSPRKRGGVGSERAAAAAKIRSCHSSSSARQGKRDNYS